MVKIDGINYIGEKELSAKYGFSVPWFRKARYNKGTPYHKLNGRVYYDESEVDKWFKENMSHHH